MSKTSVLTTYWLRSLGSTSNNLSRGFGMKQTIDNWEWEGRVGSKGGLAVSLHAWQQQQGILPLRGLDIEKSFDAKRIMSLNLAASNMSLSHTVDNLTRVGRQWSSPSRNILHTNCRTMQSERLKSHQPIHMYLPSNFQVNQREWHWYFSQFFIYPSGPRNKCLWDSRATIYMNWWKLRNFLFDCRDIRRESRDWANVRFTQSWVQRFYLLLQSVDLLTITRQVSWKTGKLFVKFLNQKPSIRQ